MEYNVRRLQPQYDFCVRGVSYIGAPKIQTAMYVTKKVAHFVSNLKGMKECLVFAEKGIPVDRDLLISNCFIFSENPQRDYAIFVSNFYEEWLEIEKKRKYHLTPEGYYIGENVTVGADAYIEPGCVIGHDVCIGARARILAGTVIKRAVIGDDFVANEGAIIGSASFTMAEDDHANKIRIPSLGKVIIGNHVEVGSANNIACGSNSDTVISDHVKLDALIHIGHDVQLKDNVEITAGSILAGFALVGERTYIGVNSTIRNRITLGNDSFIGMGSNVTKSVNPGETVAGNPARVLEQR